jgi:hypothetical protein
MAASLLLGLMSIALPAQPRRLVFHHGPGDRAHYDFSVSGRGVQEDRPVEFKLKVKCEVVFGRESGDREEIRASFISGTVDAESDGETASRKISTYTVIYQVARDGRELASKAAAGTLPEVPFAQMTFSPSDVGFLFGLPSRSVKPGDTWKCDKGLSGLGQRSGTTLTLLGEETFRGHHCLKIRSTSYLKVDETAPAAGNMRPRVQGWVSSAATILFDYERGLVLSVEGTDKFSFTTIVDDPATGQPVAHKAVFVMNERSTLTSFRSQGTG